MFHGSLLSTRAVPQVLAQTYNENACFFLDRAALILILGSQSCQLDETGQNDNTDVHILLYKLGVLTHFSKGCHEAGGL